MRVKQSSGGNESPMPTSRSNTIPASTEAPVEDVLIRADLSTGSVRWNVTHQGIPFSSDDGINFVSHDSLSGFTTRPDGVYGPIFVREPILSGETYAGEPVNPQPIAATITYESVPMTFDAMNDTPIGTSFTTPGGRTMYVETANLVPIQTRSREELMVQYPPKPKRWKPRSSGLGYYFQCDYRAALDKLAHNGQMEAPARVQSPYADHGTICHYRLQTRLDCVWGEGGVESHMPSISTFANAATLFRGNQAEQIGMATKVAELASHHLPQMPPGARWRAEDQFRYKRALTGHTDLISPDMKHLVDLKTTSRKPDHNRIKPEHYVQLMAYKLLCPSLERGSILYVDSMLARWAMRIEFSFIDDAAQEFLEHVKGYLGYLNSSKLEKRCVPRMGSHCASGFCPWVEHCRDKYIPGPGTPVEAPTQAPPVRQVTNDMFTEGTPDAPR